MQGAGAASGPAIECGFGPAILALRILPKRFCRGGSVLPTPDSAPDSKDLYAANVRYMDKLVGKLIAALDGLRMRENTLIVFVGDNGSSSGQAPRVTIRGRRLSGEKGSMLEGGALRI